MSQLKVNEAIELSKKNGKEVLKKDLAAKIWPNSSPDTQKVNMSNLCKGATKKVNPEWIVIICKETGCSSDFLLGIKEAKK